jgi:hypothetical protein
MKLESWKAGRLGGGDAGKLGGREANTEDRMSKEAILSII